MNPRDLITGGELAHLMGVARGTVYRRTVTGEIPAAAVRRIGTRMKYSVRLMRAYGHLPELAPALPDLPSPALTLSYTTYALGAP